MKLDRLSDYDHGWQAGIVKFREVLLTALLSWPPPPEQDPGVHLVLHGRGQLVHPLLEHEHPLEALIKARVKLLHSVGHPVQVGGAPGYLTDTKILI